MDYAFNFFIRNLREQNKLTQSELADILDVNVNTIKQIETDKIKAPSIKLLDKICKYVDEDRITVLCDILFCHPYIEKATEYEITQADVIARYMSYLYLNGWNVDIAPAVYQTKDIGEINFGGQLTKKREPNNKIVISSIAVKYNRDTSHIMNCEAIQFITNTMTMFLCVSEPRLRGIHVLFDYREPSHRSLFKVFKNLQLAKIPVNYQMILFEPIEGKIIDIKDLRKG